MMTYRVICFLWSPLLVIAGIVLSLGTAYTWAVGEPAGAMTIAVLCLWLVCGICVICGRHHRRQISIPAGALLMLVAWCFLSFIGMIPYGGSGVLPWCDAWFESVSAVTTTGLVTLPAVYQSLPPSLVLWRSLLAFLGGVQFLAFIVTIMPLTSSSLTMAVQGRQNVSFSPMVHPMLGRSAKVLAVYGGIAVMTAIAYAFAGNNVFYAIVQACLTVSTTGGISPFTMDTPIYEWVSVLPLLLVSTNFLLYVKVWERRSWQAWWRDAEWQVMLACGIIGSAIVAWHLWQSGLYTPLRSISHGVFHVLSFMSTTGLHAGSISHWPELDRFIVFTLPFVGASMGSLSGGLRVMRLIILGKMAKHELTRTLHPHMVVSFTVNGRAVPTQVVSFVLAYFFLFMTVYFLSVIVFTLSGITPLQAMGLAIGCLSSVGATAPLFGLTDFFALPAWLKLYSTVLMVLGRMEIFAFAILVKTALQAVRRPW